MSQLITEKENERFTANTADMTQDDFFVIAILEMCTDPELSKRFRDVKTDELTWDCLLYTSPSPRDLSTSRMPSSA